MLTLATNACATDDLRLRHVVPHWVRTFGSRLAEIVVVLDEIPPTGRVAALHGTIPPLDRVRDELDRLKREFPLLRVEPLRRSEVLDAALAKWFGPERPIRCHCGSTIAGYVLALESTRTDLVLKLDCDMLFHERGWLEQGLELVSQGTVDVVEPPRLGWTARHGEPEFSARAFLLSRERFARRLLPMRAHRIDWLRRIHRRLHGRPTYHPLEVMLEIERRAGRLDWRLLDRELGFALHLATRADAALPWTDRVVRAVESGDVPEAQAASGPDFRPHLWSPAAAGS